MPTSFEDVEWLPEARNPPQIFDASTHLDQLRFVVNLWVKGFVFSKYVFLTGEYIIFRDLHSAVSVYDPFSQGTNSNPNPQSIGECQVTNQREGNVASWPQGYTLCSHIHDEQGMVGADMADMMPHGQVNILTHIQPPRNEAAEYEWRPQQLDAQ